MAATDSPLRHLRQARGLPQLQLAAAVGITRQALGAIEAGRYIPNTLVALRLARELGCRVEDLFRLSGDTAERPVTLVGGGPADGGPRRLAAVSVRDRLLAFPLDGEAADEPGFAAGDALLRPGGDPRARLLVDEERLAGTALLLGCDPAFRLLAEHLERRRGGERLRWRHAASAAALEALARGEAHLAGTHLSSGGASDLDPVRRALAATGGTVIAFAGWEQGLVVARGNPLGLRGVADLAQPRLRFLNRQPGSGCRRMLDELLAAAGLGPEAVPGYRRIAASHFAAARQVAAGSVDASLGLRAVATACGAGFVPLLAVRCDLAVPADLAHHPAVRAALDTLQGAALRADLAALPGYDSGETGRVVATMAAA